MTSGWKPLFLFVRDNVNTASASMQMTKKIVIGRKTTDD